MCRLQGGLGGCGAAFANFAPKSPAKVNTRNTSRGPLLLVSGLQEHTVPNSVSSAAAPARE